MAALTFPRELPDGLTVTGLSFSLQPNIELSPLRGGQIISVDLGPSLWQGEWTSGPLTPEKFGEVRAWYDTLLSKEAFYGFDALREYPLAHRAGWPAGFDGFCRISSLPVDNVRIVLKDLQSGIKLSPGDYIAFDYGSNGARALHRVVVGATASGGGTATIEVRPPIRTGAAADSLVYLHRASALMIVLPGSYSESMDALSGVGRISFKAIQSL